MKPGRPCPKGGCPNLVPCDAHPQRQAWSSATPTKRIAGRQLQASRERLWIKEPMCRLCHVVLTLKQMIRDHVVSLAEGGPDTDANTQPLCARCSDAKTRREAERGMNRTSGGMSGV